MLSRKTRSVAVWFKHTKLSDKTHSYQVRIRIPEKIGSIHLTDKKKTQFFSLTVYISVIRKKHSSFEILEIQKM